MPMGEYAWKQHLEKKQEEAAEMEEMEKELHAIYAGIDPKKVALLTSSGVGGGSGPSLVKKGSLLEYQEAKRLTEGTSSAILSLDERVQVISVDDEAKSLANIENHKHPGLKVSNLISLD
mmetsp:Transcript_8660/g.11717  ORF Transcript_8660/g.11717 Transcript_8660/m.11717 type:complete len:120 (-) Transcript_8660:50-409(-)|eukprot:CAMPEP_0196572118 /NCGR_PEP_ID=MMETSP1081-20130531/2226_1 /TAXON_ID=36882 /ORGANISM="Pyramimonas amylifera, Strain CCMP720" /LENGTH=119 /DNA_ID=CAMNT_0041889323 /DNA_START=662 /DNA_END=1021 /DNA_ORIENTATION=+